MNNSTKLYLANYYKIDTINPLKSGCLFKDRRVVVSPYPSPTNQSQACINKLLSANSIANFENRRAAHSATSKLFEISPGFNALRKFIKNQFK